MAAVAALTVLLSGCVGADPQPIFTDGPPIFESEAAAVAAAREAVDRYVAAGNQMAHSGGEDLSGYDGLVSERQLADEEEDAANLRNTGRHVEGDFAVLDFRLVEYTPDDEISRIRAYLCFDLSEVHLIDSQGKDINADGHATSAPYEVHLRTRDSSPVFIIQEVREWEEARKQPEERFCSSDSYLQ